VRPESNRSGESIAGRTGCSTPRYLGKPGRGLSCRRKSLGDLSRQHHSEAVMPSA
jgi:hypothetical protein